MMKHTQPDRTDLENLGLPRAAMRTLRSIEPALRQAERVEANIQKSGIRMAEVNAGIRNVARAFDTENTSLGSTGLGYVTRPYFPSPAISKALDSAARTQALFGSASETALGFSGSPIIKVSNAFNRGAAVQTSNLLSKAAGIQQRQLAMTSSSFSSPGGLESAFWLEDWQHTIAQRVAASTLQATNMMLGWRVAALQTEHMMERWKAVVLPKNRWMVDTFTR
jgi:hypothetical protein